MKQIFIHLINAVLHLIMSMVPHMISKKKGDGPAVAKVKGATANVSAHGTNGDIKVSAIGEGGGASVSATGKSVNVDAKV